MPEAKTDIKSVPFREWTTNIDAFIKPFIQREKIDLTLPISEQLKPDARMAFIALAAVEGLEPGVIKSGPRPDGQEVIMRLDKGEEKGRFYNNLAALSTPISMYTLVEHEEQRNLAEALTLMATDFEWGNFYWQVATQRGKPEGEAPFFDLLSSEIVTTTGKTLADLTINDPIIDRAFTFSEVRGRLPIPDTQPMWKRAGLLSGDEFEGVNYREKIESVARIAARTVVASEEVMKSARLREGNEYGALRAGQFYQDVNRFIEGWVKPLGV